MGIEYIYMFLETSTLELLMKEVVYFDQLRQYKKLMLIDPADRLLLLCQLTTYR